MKVKVAKGLQNFLEDISKECTGKLGYAVARNIRIINEELTEYNNKRDELIRKYGTEKDEMITIDVGTQAYYDFVEEMKEYDDIEVDIKLMKVNDEQLMSSTLTADKMNVLMDYMVE